jgi:NitT/TauT family transport system permease protein
VKLPDRVSRLAAPAVGLAVVLVMLESLSRSGVIPRASFPPVTEIFDRLWDLLRTSEYWLTIGRTLRAWGIAMVIGVLIAVPLGMLIGSSRTGYLASKLTIDFLRPIPSVALIPLVILLVGGGPEAKITLAVYASIWPILYNTVYGLGEVDPLLTETARACGTPRRRIATSVALPCAAPFVVTGVRLSAAIALIVVVSTEFLAGASRGIGNTILQASSGAGRMDIVLAATLVAGAIGFAINEGLERLARRAFPWSTVAGAA